MATDRWAAVLAGSVAVATAAGWHAIVLLRRMRRALPSRFGATVHYYVAAGALLPIGVALGVVMAPDDLTEPVHARLALAHVAVNLLGWMGLTVVGTLVTLWPTMLHTRVADGAERAALPVLVASLAVVATGALTGSRAAAVAGIVGYSVHRQLRFPHPQVSEAVTDQDLTAPVPSTRSFSPAAGGGGSAARTRRC